MHLLQEAHALVQEGCEIPLDLLVAMVDRGINIDEFVGHVESGFQIETVIDQSETYGE